MKRWKRLKSEVILDTKFMKIRRDKVELPDKRVIDWTYWDSKDAALVIGMTKAKKLVMIRQYRYLVGDEVLEFPAGILEGGEKPEEAARREFREEAGYACKSLVKLGSFYETYGQLNRRIHIFFAKGVVKSRQELDRGKKGFEDITVELVDFDKALKLALANKIVAAGSTLAILLLKEKLFPANSNL